MFAQDKLTGVGLTTLLSKTNKKKQTKYKKQQFSRHLTTKDNDP